MTMTFMLIRFGVCFAVVFLVVFVAVLWQYFAWLTGLTALVGFCECTPKRKRANYISTVCGCGREGGGWVVRVLMSLHTLCVVYFI